MSLSVTWSVWLDISIRVISTDNERGRRDITTSAGYHAGCLDCHGLLSLTVICLCLFCFLCVCVFLSITAVLSNKCGFQLQYQMIFCVWLLAFSPQLCEQLRRYNVVPALSDILQESVKEKVTRIILAAFRVRGKHFKHYFAALDFSSLNSLCHRFDLKLLWLYMHLVESLEHIEYLLFFSLLCWDWNAIMAPTNTPKYIETLQLTQKKIANFLVLKWSEKYLAE